MIKIIKHTWAIIWRAVVWFVTICFAIGAFINVGIDVGRLHSQTQDETQTQNELNEMYDRNQAIEKAKTLCPDAMDFYDAVTTTIANGKYTDEDKKLFELFLDAADDAIYKSQKNVNISDPASLVCNNFYVVLYKTKLLTNENQK